MGFFADIPESERDDTAGRTRQPEWSGPPENVVGATVAVDLVLANTGDVAIALSGMTAYPTGVTFAIEILCREEPDEEDHGLFMEFRPGRRQGRFRVGVRFSDGRTVAGGHEWVGDDDGPRLSPRGGGGGGLHYEQEYWLWPLPPEGPLVVACEWPARGVPETLVEIDAEPIREAAARAVELWPDERPVAGDEW